MSTRRWRYTSGAYDLAQAYGLELTFVQQFTIVLVALLTSIGVAGIPAASLVAITVILGVIGLPLEGLGLLLVTDRVLDMMRTAVNIYSDSCGAAIIARSEGENTRVDAWFAANLTQYYAPQRDDKNLSFRWHPGVRPLLIILLPLFNFLLYLD